MEKEHELRHKLVANPANNPWCFNPNCPDYVEYQPGLRSSHIAAIKNIRQTLKNAGLPCELRLAKLIADNLRDELGDFNRF